MTGPLRIGILGGTFDPPHVGHLLVGQDLVQALELDELVFVPCGQPPHKGDAGVSPARDRFNMVRAAVDSNDKFRASDLELQREGPSYSVDTVRAFQQLFPGAELFFIIGSDQYAALATWKEPEELARLAKLVVMAREGEDPAGIDPGVLVSYLTVPVIRVDISSSAIRERVRAGLPVRYRVRRPVRRIIAQQGLYRDS